MLISYIEPYLQADGYFDNLAQSGVNAFGMELIHQLHGLNPWMLFPPKRISLAIERFLRRVALSPLLSFDDDFFAGSSKAAKVMVLGAGVAGLQAIATAKRLGAQVEAYDVRAEVKEQILSLGAKFVELDIGEEGSGKGGYAKELSAEAKQRQQQLLTERLKKCDIIISTANIPGRKAPVLITEDARKRDEAWVGHCGYGRRKWWKLPFKCGRSGGD